MDNQVLIGKVYLANEESPLIKLRDNLHLASSRIDEVLTSVVYKDYPMLVDSLSISSTSNISILVGSDAELRFNDELKVSNSINRQLKKKSKLLQYLKDSVGDEIYEWNKCHFLYYFELGTRYGINNVRGTHKVGDDLYISLKNDPDDNSDELTLVSYDKYLIATISN